MGRDAGNFLSLKINVATIRLVEGGNDIEQRRFACTIRADQSDDFPLLQVQVDVLQDLKPAKTLADPVQTENRIAVFHFGLLPGAIEDISDVKIL